MRRFILGGALVMLCVLPVALRRVEAQAKASGDGFGSGAASHNPTVWTLARNVVAGGLAADGSGRVYFTANDQVYRLTHDVRLAADGRATPNGGLEAIAGTGLRGFAGDGGPANAAEFSLIAPGGNLGAEPAGSLFVADTLNDTVRRIDAESQLISSVAGRWAAGASAAAAREIVRPGLVGVDASGNLFGAGNNVLWRLGAGGEFSQIASVSNPTALAVSRDGASVAVAAAGGQTLIVFQRREASHYGIAFTHPTAIGATNGQDAMAGQVARFAAGQSAAGRDFSGIAIDAAGNIFVSDAAANEIDRVEAATLKVAIFAGTGHAGYSGDGGPPAAAEFNSPGALAIDRDGDLLVADTGNHAIREITHAAAVAGVTLTPNTFTFPNEPIGGASAPQAFTLTNNSAVQVTGVGITIEDSSSPPNFTETSNCATTLDAGASCAINVVFMPQAAGNRSGALHVTDSDPSSPQTAALAGFADDYELQLQTGNTDTLTVIAGAEANYNLAVVPDDTFSGTVTVNCPVGLPTDTTCGITAGTAPNPSGLPSGMLGPASLDISVTPGAAQNFFVTLVTQARGQTSVVAPVRKLPRFPAPPVIVIAISSLAMIAMWRRRRGAWTRRHFAVAGFAAVTLLMITSASGCSSSSTTPIKTKPNPGTPAGTTHLNVIGNSQGASRGFTITLIVQQ